jgi:RNA polymerase sigma-70 factor (ECF subfamily)
MTDSTVYPQEAQGEGMGGGKSTEAALVAAARDGDRDAFAELVERYERPVFSLTYRMLGNYHEAEDAAQESFLRAFRALGGYDFRRSFSTWLLSIAAHHCIDRLRRRRDVVSLDAMPAWNQLPAQTVDPQRMAERSDQAASIQAGLNELPDDYRLVLVLRYWHDFGYQEIAALVGDTESAIKSRLHRARRRLAEVLADRGTGDAGTYIDITMDGASNANQREGTAQCSAIAPAS